MANGDSNQKQGGTVGVAGEQSGAGNQTVVHSGGTPTAARPAIVPGQSLGREQKSLNPGGSLGIEIFDAKIPKNVARGVAEVQKRVKD